MAKTMTSRTTKNRPKNVGYDRIDRIGDLIHRSIAKLLALECRDPRLTMVTVASVEVSRDLAHAKIYITVLDESKVTETLKVLNGASSFFRSSLAQLLKLRVIPRPRFIFDQSVIQGTRIESLLEQVNES
jgi:ribosome-binding factor A